MLFRHLSLFRCNQISEKTKVVLKIVVSLLCLSIAVQASAVLLFHDDFEKDKIGAEPSKWEVGHDGNTVAQVVADPKKASNKVLLTADKASNASRHDVGGSIYVVGDAGWDDYVAEWDMMFPDDFYMGVVFRFQEGEKFYLSDRRQGGREYHFYKRQGGWAKVKDGMVEMILKSGIAHNLSSLAINSPSNSKNGRTRHPLTKSTQPRKVKTETSKPASSATTDSSILITSLSGMPSKTSFYPLSRRINSA